MPHVPIVGWDVAFTPQGVFLLEVSYRRRTPVLAVLYLSCLSSMHHHPPCSPGCAQVNLSCNFFKGRFDVPRYIDFVDKYWTFLQTVEQKHGIFGYKARIVEALWTPRRNTQETESEQSATAGAAGLKEE